jgi:hypothetical protein
MATWRIALFLALAAAPGAASGNGDECYQRRDPARPHVEVPIEQPPNLKFHPDQERTGKAVLALDASGLYREGKRICVWHGGAFEAVDVWDRGLQPASKAAGEKNPHCPGLPIVSTCDDLGLGGAHIYIEFVRHDAVVLEARCAGKPCYLAMAELPRGWSEAPSAQEAERKRRAEIAAKRNIDPALGEFLDGSQACLSRKDVPACLEAFVSEHASMDTYPDPPRQLPDAGPERARAVIDRLWSSTEAREWVDGCIRQAPAGVIWDVNPTELNVSLPESFIFCTIRKESAGWRLFEVGASD